MRTFKEFLFIAERYYKPDEKLPSGKTPIEKASSKIGKPKQLERMAKVRRGADNPEFDRTPHSDLSIYKSPNSNYTLIDHKPSGIQFSVTHGKSNKTGKERHSISWEHDKEYEDLSPDDKMKIISNAKKVWKQHIEPRFPHGSTLHNMPTANETDEGKNTRAKVYQRFGFGPLDKTGYSQYAKVGRPPSPKQAAKGKRRLKPILSPEEN